MLLPLTVSLRTVKSCFFLRSQADNPEGLFPKFREETFF